MLPPVRFFAATKICARLRRGWQVACTYVMCACVFWEGEAPVFGLRHAYMDVLHPNTVPQCAENEPYQRWRSHAPTAPLVTRRKLPANPQVAVGIGLETALRKTQVLGNSQTVGSGLNLESTAPNQRAPSHRALGSRWLPQMTCYAENRGGNKECFALGKPG